MAQNSRAAVRAARSGTAAPNASHGSQTILQTEAGPARLPTATLRLRAEPSEDTASQAATEDARRVRWAEEVIDNEGMGKKSSKICCIYHAPHTHGDSDSDDSSSSDDDSDPEPDLSRAQPAGGRRGPGGNGSKGKGKGKERKPSPNAYERQPSHQKAGPG